MRWRELSCIGNVYTILAFESGDSDCDPQSGLAGIFLFGEEHNCQALMLADQLKLRVVGAGTSSA